MVRTFLVKTANSVAMVAERCVMIVALRWSFEKVASKRLDWFRLQYQNSWDGETRQEKMTRKG